MAREISDILKELDAGYAPQRNVYNEQINSIEPAQAGEVAGLEQAKTDSFNQITQGANRRGMFYSGIPIAEQAKYVGSTYLPALAGLKNRYLQQRFNLQAALAGLGERQLLEATKVRNDELDREERQRQWEQQVALERERMAAAARSGGGGGGGGVVSGGGGGGGGITLQQFLQRQYAANPNANRATQDSWVRAWAQLTGNNANDSGLWAAYNTMYPWEQWSDSRFGGNVQGATTPYKVSSATAPVASPNPLKVW